MHNPITGWTAFTRAWKCSQPSCRQGVRGKSGADTHTVWLRNPLSLLKSKSICWMHSFSVGSPCRRMDQLHTGWPMCGWVEFEKRDEGRHLNEVRNGHQAGQLMLPVC